MSTNMQEYIEQAEKDLLHTYNRYQIVLDKGDGVYLYDMNGKKYLDFCAGIAVFALGYHNEEYNNALKSQIDKLIHTSNYYYNVPAIEAARKLKKVSGMDRADSGEVWMGGTEISALSEDDRARLRLSQMGFVFQQMNMLKNLNLIDNIMLPACCLKKGKTSEKEHEQRARMLMRKMGIEKLAERKITEVSGGQLQRACICRSMINQPDILFADEPTGALNQGAAQEVMREFIRLNQEGTTILMVTHDSRVAAKCGRILYLLDGSIQGELSLAGMTKEKEKEEKVGRGLAGMGW